MAETVNAPLGKLGHFVSDMLGSMAGNAATKAISEILVPDQVKKRQGQLMTLLLGPSDDDEQDFVGALFGEMIEISPTKDKEHLQETVDRLFAKIEDLETEQQDAFRKKTIQYSEHDEKKPDLKRSAKVLYGIAWMSDTTWQKFRKALNLTKGNIPFDVGAQCQRLEQELAELKNQPELNFWQKFNFFRLT